MSDELTDYDYDLPAELVARHPPPHREDARLMVVDRVSATISHRGIQDLPRLLSPGDCLVLNNTRVLKARLLGHRQQTGGRWEGLFLGPAANGSWRLLGQTRGKLRPGECIVIVPAHDLQSRSELCLQLVSRDDEGIWEARPVPAVDPWQALDRFGTMPLPPYMERELASADDFERYQTTFAQEPGSVAAPTAGLHFTPELFDQCTQAGIARAFVTLHVGIGTFRPISVERLSDHKMHSEWAEVPAATTEALRSTRANGRKIVAVGTTSTRTLETVARAATPEGWRGLTDLFIRPPFEFKSVDALLTNFHLPRSTLLVLVSAFAGRELITRAYDEAIRERYRFFSYGDAMLIL